MGSPAGAITIGMSRVAAFAASAAGQRRDQNIDPAAN
jgi:hypothetical protein